MNMMICSCRGAIRSFVGDVTLTVVDSIKERCLQWIGRERKLTLVLTLILTFAITIWDKGGRASRLHVVMKTEQENTITNFFFRNYILIYKLYVTGIEWGSWYGSDIFFSIFIELEFDDKMTINEGDKAKI